MKTPTHALIGWGCARLFGWDKARRRVLIVGAVAPDLPLALVWTWLAGTISAASGTFDQPTIQAAMDRLYFAETWVMALHNLLHAPVSLAYLALAGCAVLAHAPRLLRLWLAFLTGALCHALVDIATHVTDGPLLAWPLETSWRLVGPISHWDPHHGGIAITLVEGAALLFAAALWATRRVNRDRTGPRRPEPAPGGGGARVVDRW